ncbi:hypothetical protein ACWN8V_05315 [Vagococcus elongatus]|uniref:Lipoprotein n=1 Tax=Vagococcus elongatus TaxID=180344 RepID=A0A430ANT5_9ENTE|nr:hypothetical protein [Vagococcus elongatus]RSU09574.1 hypothetical protein CBF29_11255 [Vagococcus elongatus]
MKKFFPLLLLIMLITACGNKSQKKVEVEGTSTIQMTGELEKSSSSERQSETIYSEKNEEEITIDLGLYDQIIDKYALFEQELHNQDSQLNGMAFLVIQDFYTGLYATTHDIDSDQTPELLISLGTKQGSFTLLDIYTISTENSLIHLTSADNELSSIGERMTLDPLEDGKLLYTGSSSATEILYRLFEFNKEKTDLSLIIESPNRDGLGSISEPIDLTQLNWQLIVEG